MPLQLSCVMTTSSGSGATTQLIAYVNGTQVGAIGDQVDEPGVGGYVPILILGTYGPQVTVAFTNIVVRSISPSS